MVGRRGLARPRSISEMKPWLMPAAVARAFCVSPWALRHRLIRLPTGSPARIAIIDKSSATPILYGVSNNLAIMDEEAPYFTPVRERILTPQPWSEMTLSREHLMNVGSLEFVREIG